MQKVEELGVQCRDSRAVAAAPCSKDGARALPLSLTHPPCRIQEDDLAVRGAQKGREGRVEEVDRRRVPRIDRGAEVKGLHAGDLARGCKVVALDAVDECGAGDVTWWGPGEMGSRVAERAWRPSRWSSIDPALSNPTCGHEGEVLDGELADVLPEARGETIELLALLRNTLQAARNGCGIGWLVGGGRRARGGGGGRRRAAHLDRPGERDEDLVLPSMAVVVRSLGVAAVASAAAYGWALYRYAAYRHFNPHCMKVRKDHLWPQLQPALHNPWQADVRRRCPDPQRLLCFDLGTVPGHGIQAKQGRCQAVSSSSANPGRPTPHAPLLPTSGQAGEAAGRYPCRGRDP